MAVRSGVRLAYATGEVSRDLDADNFQSSFSFSLAIDTSFKKFS